MLWGGAVDGWRQAHLAVTDRRWVIHHRYHGGGAQPSQSAPDWIEMGGRATSHRGNWVKLADTPALGVRGRKGVKVRVP